MQKITTQIHQGKLAWYPQINKIIEILHIYAQMVTFVTLCEGDKEMQDMTKIIFPDIKPSKFKARIGKTYLSHIQILG